MSYFQKIQELTKTVNPEIVDFSSPRDEARIPTQASSEFITNKEQGDWAETVLFEAINNISNNYVAVHYGKSITWLLEMKVFQSSFMRIKAN